MLRTPRSCTVAQAIDAVLDIVATRPDDTVWIGVDGRGASGKSTFAARLAAASSRVAVVAVDDFSGPGVPEWDWPRFAQQVVVPLSAGRAARYERRPWNAPAGGLTGADGWRTVVPGQVVVVEGVSATRGELEVAWALRLWLDVPRDVRLRRALERDGPAMQDRWLTDWLPAEEAYVARDRPQSRADLIVDAATEA